MNVAVSLHAQLASLRPMLLKMAYRYLRNKEWAEDVVHDALLAVLEQPERFAGRSTLSTYVGAILKYKVGGSVLNANQQTGAILYNGCYVNIAAGSRFPPEGLCLCVALV